MPDNITTAVRTLARLTALLRLANIFRLRGDHERADYYIAKMWQEVDDAR